MSFLLLHQVSMGETQSSVKILPRLLRSGSTDNVGLGLRNERSYSHFQRTHTSGVFTCQAWARCSRGIRHARCGLFAAIHTRLTWARCSRGIRHARRGLFAGVLTRLTWAHCSRGIRHARRGFFMALLTRLAWARFSCSICHIRRDLFRLFSYALRGLVVLAVSVMPGMVSSQLFSQALRGLVVLGRDGHIAGHGNREVGLWREITDCVETNLQTNYRALP